MDTAGRWCTAAAGLLLLGPPLAVGLAGLGMPLVAAGPAVAAGAAWLAWSGRVPALPIERLRRRPLVALLWVSVLAVAAVSTWRASVFAHDPLSPQYSATPGDRFREEHLCLTAYAEAARLVLQPGAQVYDPELYLPGGARRRIGTFTVDPFHYPPPFLLLPVVLRGVAPDFLDLRRVWFAMQVALLAATWLAMARWIGGVSGQRVALAGPLLWAFPITWSAFQVGNFQTSAFALAMLGVITAASGRVVSGAALLASATLAKIFPALLVLHVLAWRRWRLTAWLAVAGAALTVLAAVSFGPRLYYEFLFVELPRMLAGAAFPQTENPWNAPINQSFYGLTTKLRQLGVAGLDAPAGRMAARAMAAAVAVAAVAVGWRVVGPARLTSVEHRVGLICVAFGIVNLASFISPFVGVAYGSLGTVCLATLLAVCAPSRTGRVVAATGLAILVSVTWMVSSPRPGVPPAFTTLLVAMAGHLALVAVNAGAIWFGARLIGERPDPERGLATARTA